jgi:hypothetical protein
MSYGNLTPCRLVSSCHISKNHLPSSSGSSCGCMSQHSFKMPITIYKWTQHNIPKDLTCGRCSSDDGLLSFFTPCSIFGFFWCGATCISIHMNLIPSTKWWKQQVSLRVWNKHIVLHGVKLQKTISFRLSSITPVLMTVCLESINVFFCV